AEGELHTHLISTHVLSLIVSTDLASYALIVPCGISSKDAGVTSLAQELGRPVSMREVEAAMVRHLAALFGAGVRERRPDRRTVSVSVLRRTARGIGALLLYRHPH